jgi:hypothetical protein
MDCTRLVKTYDEETYNFYLDRIRATVQPNRDWSEYVERFIHRKRHLFAKTNSNSDSQPELEKQAATVWVPWGVELFRLSMTEAATMEMNCTPHTMEAWLDQLLVVAYQQQI